MNPLATEQINYCAARAAYETISAECKRRTEARFGPHYMPETAAEMDVYCDFEVQAETDLGRPDALKAKHEAEDALIAAGRAWATIKGFRDTAVFDQASHYIHIRQKLVDICMSIQA